MAAKIHGEFIEFGITERLKQTRNPDTSPKKLLEWRPAFLFTATGALSLRSRAITEQHRWADSESRRVEDQLNDFVLALFEAAISHRESRRRHAEQERRNAEESLRRYEENRRIKELEDECAAWTRSRQLRAYLSAVERTARRKGPIEAGGKLDRWLGWARAHADATDPLVGS